MLTEIKNLDNMSPEEVEALNATTREDLAESVEKYESDKNATISSALDLLIHVIESETLDVVFIGPAGESIIKVMASPPQKLLEQLFKIGNRAEGAQVTSDADERKLCNILEYICIKPKISFDMWMSGQLSDDVPAKIIFELMKYKLTKHDEMVSEVESFRKDERGSKNLRGVRSAKKGTE